MTNSMQVLARRAHPTSETQRIAPMADAARELLAGRYELQDRIGHAGMAELFTARDRKLGRIVVIKRPRRGDAGDVALADRLQREAIALAMIDSPHVVAIHDVGNTPRGMYLVLQHLPGRTLDEIIADHGPVAPERACRIARDILTGLSAIHTAGLVHRDLKPSNVLVGLGDRAVLYDLGSALHPRKRLPTDPDTAALGDHPPVDPVTGDGRTDLFQVGLILILLVTGTMAWRAVDPEKLGVAPELRDVICRALAPVEMRFGNALEMRRAIDHAIASSTRATSMRAPTHLPPRRITLRWSGPLPRP